MINIISCILQHSNHRSFLGQNQVLMSGDSNLIVIHVECVTIVIFALREIIKMSTIPAHAKEVLLVTTSHVGSNLFCTPAIRLLKKTRPNLQLDLLALSQPGGEVFHNNPDIRKIFVKKNFSWRIRRLAKRYDSVIVLHKMVAKKYFAKPQSNIICPESFTAIHRADQTLEFMQTLLNCPITEADRQYVINAQPHHHQQIQSLLLPFKNQILIGMHLGCGRTAEHGWKFWYKKRDKAHKLWPLSRYIELAGELKKLNPNIRIVITGSKNERFLAKSFLQAIPDSIDLIGKTSIQSLAALMNCLKLFVTQDTGTLHVACTTELPIIGLFGSTLPEVTGPYPLRPHHVILKKNHVADITAAEVAEATTRILDGALMESF